MIVRVLKQPLSISREKALDTFTVLLENASALPVEVATLDQHAGHEELFKRRVQTRVGRGCRFSALSDLTLLLVNPLGQCVTGEARLF